MEPHHDEVLKLGPPATGEVVIKVDPRRTGTPFSMGIETLAPAAAIPLHRYLSKDEVVFIYKGQGRATLNEKSMTVLPGTTLFIPRQTWFGLRNTGTGLLQFIWTAAPPGIEEFFREMSRLGPKADAATLNSLAQRHGIEFRPAGETMQPSGHRPHRRHRRRRGGRGGTPASSVAAPPAPSAPSLAPQPSAVSALGQPHSRRRRRRRHGRPIQPAAAATATPPSQPSKAPPRRPQGRPLHRRGRVKEVYMEGRWVQVSGEGPVIAPGRDRPREGGSRAERDDDTPAGPLSVPL